MPDAVAREAAPSSARQISDAVGVASALRAHEEELLQRWVARVTGDPAVPESSRLPEPALRNHVPRLLERILRALEAPHGDAEPSARSLGRDEAAAQHAAHRFESNYEMAAALRELSHLRMAILDLLEVLGVVPGIPALRALAAALDEAMTTTAVEMQRAAQQAVAREIDVRERFLAALAHELRQPLHGVLWSASVLLDSPGIDADARRAAERGRRSAEHMRVILDDVLVLSRAHRREEIPLEVEEVDLSDVAAEVVAEARGVTPGARIELRAGGDLTGLWDRARVAHVVASLLGNAVQHGAAGAPVGVELRDEGASVAVRVENQNRRGPIPPELRAVLFDPFERRARFGAGLGLCVACAVVRAHGGAIEVASEAATTVFTARLPRRPMGSGDGGSWASARGPLHRLAPSTGAE